MYGGGETGGSSSEYFGSYGYGGTQTGNSGGSSYITATQSTTGGTAPGNCYSGFGFGGMGTYTSSGYAGAGGGAGVCKGPGHGYGTHGGGRGSLCLQSGAPGGFL